MNSEMIGGHSEFKEPAALDAITLNHWGNYIRTKAEVIESPKFTALKHRIVKGEGVEGEHTNHYDGYDYYLDLKDTEGRGHLRASIFTIEEREQEFGVDEGLKNLGLLPEDKVMAIWDFYPNGSRHPENQRQGVGTAALNMLLADALSDGVKAIRVTTIKEPMKRFLESNGFQAVDNSLTTYVKVI